MITGVYADSNFITTSSVTGSLSVYINGISRELQTENLNAYITSNFNTNTDKGSSIFGIGSTFLLNSNSLPDLNAAIDAVIFIPPSEYNLSAYIRSNFASQTSQGSSIFGNGSAFLIDTRTLPDLEASIDGVPKRSTQDLLAYIQPTIASSSSLLAFIRPTLSSYFDLGASVEGIALQDLNGFYRALQSRYGDLNGFIEPSPPVDLYAEYQAFQYAELSGYISPIEGITLSANILGLSVEDLYANIEGVNTSDLSGSIDGVFQKDLYAIYTGLGSGLNNLNAHIEGNLGVNYTEDLGGIIIPSNSGLQGLNARYVTNFPIDLPATYSAIIPSSLYASYSATTSNDLSATISGYLFSGGLLATITSTGSYTNLSTYITSNTQGQLDLTSTIEGTISSDLFATIESDKVLDLYAEIDSTGTRVLSLGASYTTQSGLDLTASYDLTVNSPLNAEIAAISPVDLSATIKPKYYFIESSILINTFAVRDLRARINANTCYSRSDFEDLAVFISAQQAGDLQAKIVAVQGQYTVASNRISITRNLTNKYQNWLPILLTDPAITYNKARIDLVTSPILDLHAEIEGVQLSSDLNAEIKSLYYSNPTTSYGGTPIINWVNTLTGEVKSVRIYFEGDNLTYYYSEDANKVFTLDPFNKMVVVVESYNNLEDDGTLLYAKQNTNSCIIDNLERFSSIDEAIKFGIECAVATFGTNLSASITAIGGLNDLTAEIIAEDTPSYDLNMSYNGVTYVPDLEATISGTVSFSDLNIYLTPLTASGTLSGTLAPDLNVYIVGIGIQNLAATISGV